MQDFNMKTYKIVHHKTSDSDRVMYIYLLCHGCFSLSLTRVTHIIYNLNFHCHCIM